MKTVIAMLLISTVAQAHTIQGTPVKAGEVKSSGMLRGVEVKCSMKIDGKGLLGIGGQGGVRNLLKEDQFGNPAYKVTATVKLKSKDKELLPLDFEEKITFTNLHAEGVSDELYETIVPEAPAPTAQRPNPVAPRRGTLSRFVIDSAGNITGLSVATSLGSVNCRF